MKAAIFLPLSAAALMIGCITGGSGGLPSAGGGSEKTISSYTIVGDKIVTPARVDTLYDCNGDSPEVYLDTVPAESLSYELSGNSLKFFDNHLDTLPSGAVAQTAILSDRVGSGTGLEGAWNYRKYKSEIVSGAPTAADLDTLAKRDSLINGFISLEVVQVRFSNGMISTYIDANTAENFVKDWNGGNFGNTAFADSGRYDVAVRALSRYVVELKGRKTGEIVTLTLANDGSKTFTSSVPAHAEFRFTANSRTCPSDPEPAWYYDFLMANPKGIINDDGDFTKAKRGAIREIRSKTGIPGYFRPFPLKTPGSLLN